MYWEKVKYAGKAWDLVQKYTDGLSIPCAFYGPINGRCSDWLEFLLPTARSGDIITLRGPVEE